MSKASFISSDCIAERFLPIFGKVCSHNCLTPKKVPLIASSPKLAVSGLMFNGLYIKDSFNLLYGAPTALLKKSVN